MKNIKGNGNPGQSWSSTRQVPVSKTCTCNTSRSSAPGTTPSVLPLRHFWPGSLRVTRICYDCAVFCSNRRPSDPSRSGPWVWGGSEDLSGREQPRRLRRTDTQNWPRENSSDHFVGEAMNQSRPASGSHGCDP